MKCPDCGSVQWERVERDAEGVNILVRCLDCFTVYKTKYHPEYQEKFVNLN